MPDVIRAPLTTPRPAVQLAKTNMTVAWGRREWLLVVALVAITTLAFHRVLAAEFVNYDDPGYVTRNGHVQSGLTWPGVAWACTATEASNWHPLTWLSLMLDAELFGAAAWGYHLTNLLLHAANACLLFAAFWLMTGACWRSAVVAALFAVHPLHVESVAWISERKDVLSTLFGLLALLAYVRYARQPTVRRYLYVFGAFALSLLAKPMLVTLPCLLLLLDYWPLCRWRPETGESGRPSARRLILEKLPLLALSAGCATATVWAQHHGHALRTLEALPLGARTSNAVVSYVVYLLQALWPSNLAVAYPLAGSARPWSYVALAGLALSAITITVFRWGRQRPYLPVGWLWYLGTLVPVIGLVQAGGQSQADRFTYFPLIGIFLLCTWGIADLVCLWRPARWATIAVLAGIMALVWASDRQTRFWHDSVTLWRRALEVSGNYAHAQIMLGNALDEQGKPGEAARHYWEAVRLDPTDPAAQHNLANDLVNLGEPDQAIEHFRAALRLDPTLAQTHTNLAWLLLTRHELREAAEHLEAALQLDPEAASPNYDFGLLYGIAGDWNKAVAALQRATALRPGLAEYHRELAFALARAGRQSEAVTEYRRAVELEPAWPGAALRSAWALATNPQARLRNGARALHLAEQVAQLTEEHDPVVLDVLAAAQAENGRFSEAESVARKALGLASRPGQRRLADAITARLHLYEQRQPYRSGAP